MKAEDEERRNSILILSQEDKGQGQIWRKDTTLCDVQYYVDIIAELYTQNLVGTI